MVCSIKPLPQTIGPEINKMVSCWGGVRFPNLFPIMIPKSKVINMIGNAMIMQSQPSQPDNNKNPADNPMDKNNDNNNALFSFVRIGAENPPTNGIIIK